MWLTLAITAAVPDVDAIGRLFGAGDIAWLGGHRALTHSLTFAAAAGLLLTLPAIRSAAVSSAARLWIALSLAIASHGALDALTMYGEGIQFLAPWSTVRYWAPWRLLGDGIVRDSLAFIVFFAVARLTMIWRGLPLPRALNPRFLQGVV